jgi:diadenosine tetraphosphate (Ap4A) HIT family hydrolase
MSADEWLHLQSIVQRIAQAVSESTQAVRMYIASLGSPERNAHLHIHVCPCPPDTPFHQQQFEAMQITNGQFLQLDENRMRELASQIRAALENNR